MRRIAKSAATLCGLVVATLFVAACGESEDRVVVTASEADFVPVIESSDVYVDMPRLVLILLEQDVQPSLMTARRS